MVFLDKKKQNDKGKIILLFPLSNVLGHLSRTLALAEQLSEDNFKVYIAVSDYYQDLFYLIDPRITLISTLEMCADSTKKFGQIYYDNQNNLQEKEILENSTQLKPKELKRRSKILKQILKKDTEIIEQLKPDAIILDYHYPPLMVEALKKTEVFLLSNKIGYPSFCNRIFGGYPYPLNTYKKLVPGIASFDSTTDNESDDWLYCGIFSWKGWRKIASKVPKNDVFLFFGSTGCTEKLTPWLIENLSDRYKLSYLSTDNQDGQFINLDTYINQTKLVICHGGHGTVLECILKKKPMLIIPNNLEQLEIGKRVQTLKLGVLISKPYDKITINELTTSINRLLGDKVIKQHLSSFSEKISKENGVEKATNIIKNKLNGR